MGERIGAAIGTSASLAEALLPECELIRDKDIRRRTVAALERCLARSHWDDLAAMPLTPEIPVSKFDALEHVRAVVDMVGRVADSLEAALGIAVDRDLLLSAAILHDASKWLEFEPADGPAGEQLSEEGRALAHASYAAVVALEEGLPGVVADAIAAHTPSSTRPTSSAISVVLHHVDLLITDCCRLESGLNPRFKLVSHQ